MRWRLQRALQHIAKRVFFRFFCGFSGPAATWQRRGLQGVVIAESQRETPGSITKCRIRTDHAANFTTVRHMHMALSLIRRAPGRGAVGIAASVPKKGYFSSPNNDNPYRQTFS